jgi:hypothetical protein
LNALVAEENHKSEVGEAQAMVNPLQVRLNALKFESFVELMYAPIEANSCKSLAMMDIGATHNFVAIRMVEQLGLKLSKCPSRLKAMNFESQPTVGIAYAVPLKVGKWLRNINFLVVPLDDFYIILGNKFFMLTKAILMPFLGRMLIMDELQP